MISIITTFFNAEDFLEANLRSVQSISSQDMIEHILLMMAVQINQIELL